MYEQYSSSESGMIYIPFHVVLVEAVESAKRGEGLGGPNGLKCTSACSLDHGTKQIKREKGSRIHRISQQAFTCSLVKNLALFIDIMLSTSLRCAKT